jgi:hypothetical protein
LLPYLFKLKDYGRDFKNGWSMPAARAILKEGYFKKRRRALWNGIPSNTCELQVHGY